MHEAVIIESVPRARISEHTAAIPTSPAPLVSQLLSATRAFGGLDGLSPTWPGGLTLWLKGRRQRFDIAPRSEEGARPERVLSFSSTLLDDAPTDHPIIRSLVNTLNAASGLYGVGIEGRSVVLRGSEIVCEEGLAETTSRLADRAEYAKLVVTTRVEGIANSLWALGSALGRVEVNGQTEPSDPGFRKLRWVDGFMSSLKRRLGEDVVPRKDKPRLQLLAHELLDQRWLTRVAPDFQSLVISDEAGALSLKLDLNRPHRRLGWGLYVSLRARVDGLVYGEPDLALVNRLNDHEWNSPRGLGASAAWSLISPAGEKLPFELHDDLVSDQVVRAQLAAAVAERRGDSQPVAPAQVEETEGAYLLHESFHPNRHVTHELARTAAHEGLERLEQLEGRLRSLRAACLGREWQ